MGIEPTLEAWEASVLPLNYARSAEAHCSPRPRPRFNPHVSGMQITVNSEARRLDRPLTIAELLDELGLGGRRVAVERNGEIVPRSRHPQTPLADGDQLLIVQAIGGG